MSRKFSVPRWTATHTTCTTATTAILNILTTFILSAATADVFLHKTPDGIILDMVYSNAFPSVVLFLLLLVTMAFLYCGVYRILRFFFIKSMRGGIRLMEKTPDWFAIQIKRKRRKEREKMYRM